MMRKRAKHSVGVLHCERGAAEERGGDGRSGKIRGRAGRTEGEGTETRRET